MNRIILISITAFSLAGCPDSRVPKTPPNVPAPKLASIKSLVLPHLHVGGDART
jgi:hypothetical protein